MGDAASPINVILDGADGLGGERLVGGVRDVGLELRLIQHQRHWMGEGGTYGKVFQVGNHPLAKLARLQYIGC